MNTRFLSSPMAYDTILKAYDDEIRLHKNAFNYREVSGIPQMTSTFDAYIASKLRNISALEAVAKTDRKTLNATIHFLDEDYFETWGEFFQPGTTLGRDLKVLNKLRAIEDDQEVRYSLMQGWAHSRGYPEVAMTFTFAMRDGAKQRENLARLIRGIMRNEITILSPHTFQPALRAA